MANVTEVARIEAALKNKGVKELEWSLWYCKMRQSVASARPADVKYWRAVEEKVSELLAPAVEERRYPAKKKKAGRGLGFGGEIGVKEVEKAEPVSGPVED